MLLFWSLVLSELVLPIVQVVSHMMPDLPNVGLERDIEQFIVSKLYFPLMFSFVNITAPFTVVTIASYFIIKGIL